MVKAIRVKGNVLSLQSNLDFYRKIVSTGESKSVDTLRRHFFDMFIEEDIERYTTAVQVNRKPEKVENTKVQEDAEVPNSPRVSSLEFLSSIQKIQKLNSNRVVVEEEDSVEYSEHGVFIEDLYDSIVEKGIETSESSKPLMRQSIVDTESYTEHGVYIEDLTFEEVEQLEENTEGNTEVYETEKKNMDFVEHGVYIEDIVILEGATEEGTSEGEELNEVTSEEDSNEDALDVDDIWKGFEEDTDVKDTAVTEPIERVNSNKLNTIEEEVEKVNVPREVRDFLKKHPGSTVAYVEQYYSRKEIERNIKLGKIYRKKGKLFI